MPTKPSGVPEPAYVAARRALLDALEALGSHLPALVLVGAQAVYVHTGDGEVGVAPYTADADLALDPSLLGSDPLLKTAMTRGGFALAAQPGIWASPTGVTVDLLVPESLGDRGGRRGARLGVHGRKVAHRARGLEGCLVDKAPHMVEALEPADARRFEVAVAGPAALIVSKVHKIADPERRRRARVKDKDALDILRLLQAVQLDEIAAGFGRLRTSHLAAVVTAEAIENMRMLFANVDGAGSDMVARAVAGVADEAQVRLSLSTLARDLLARLE